MRKPEVLAPAGDDAALTAALAAGADAVYFGLDDGFNARARATNFSIEKLPATVDRIHRAGARAYLTLNTLVFEPELPVMEDVLRRVAAAGVDAIIVQDPAVALLARAIAPTLEIHASTQMTISSGDGAAFAKTLGATRMVAPRELSVEEIRALAGATDLELEVFIHGALCVSWSGQCLSSEAWGARSANRGQCAQSCRLPYDLVVDGETRDLGDVRYLLSPRDLAGWDAVPELAPHVHGLKIEGRQKGPEYVATAVAGYRARVDGAADADARAWLEPMALAYSRGFSAGFLGGSDHQTLVEGRAPKHRGLFLGTILAVERAGVLVESSAPEPRAGQGVVFDAGHPEAEEQGGPIFAVERTIRGWRLGFGRPGPDLSRVHVGDRVWITGDPAVDAIARKLREPDGRVPIDLTVRGAAGEPLRVTARDVTIESRSPLAPANQGGIDRALLEDKLGAFGGTPFHLRSLTIELPGSLHLPVSDLKDLRRRLVAALEPTLTRPHAISPGPDPVPGPGPVPGLTSPVLVPLCRTDAHLDAALATDLPEVELDWMELVGLGRAVERARAAGKRVTIATVRVQKPGEEGFDSRIAKLRPDAILVRHWGAMMTARRTIPTPTLIGDFSLNVTNSITARHLLGLGLDGLTAAHDLDEAQLFALLAAAPADRFTVAVHHHIPTFHTEHCVYAHLLSDGRDFRTCGRPCEEKQVALRDRVGLVHPIVVDVGCRNTVFNAQAQSAASLVPRLLAAGVRRFRVELVREPFAEARAVLDAYRELIAGAISPAQLLARVGVHEQFGVTRGTMAVRKLRVVDQ
jgi:putative protease